MRRTIRNLLATLAVAAVTAGCIFSSLEDDLELLDDVAHLFSGEVSTVIPDSHAIVVVAMHDVEGRDIASFRMLGTPGVFEIRANAVPTRFFGFTDLNRDLIFQDHEPWGWAEQGRALDPDREPTDSIRLIVGETGAKRPPFPRRLVGEPLDSHLNNYVRPAIGEVTPLDSPLFSRSRAEKGLWTPFAFVEEGGAGIHFLEPYDSGRIPVLFVHGINASPRDFSAMIAALDTTRYQVWVMSYPTGLRLSWVARGMYQFLEVLHRQHGFDKLHIVAHSMGGLVSRGSVNLCARNRNCDYLASYTTISTPWNGVASARNGVQWAPTAVPVWHDLDPGSGYIQTLFDAELPDDLSYHLLFGYRHDKVFGAESSDGVIRLTSQLRHDAQIGADSVRGFDEGHVSILQNDAVIEKVFAHIAGDN